MEKVYVIYHNRILNEIKFVKLNIDSVGKADQIKISPEVAFGNSQSYEVMLNLTSQKKETTSHNKS